MRPQHRGHRLGVAVKVANLRLLQRERPDIVRLTTYNAEVEGVTGAEVREIEPGSTAEKAGLEAGDVITKIDDRHLSGADALIATIRSYRPGDEVTVTWQRGGDEQSAEVVLDSDAD